MIIKNIVNDVSDKIKQTLGENNMVGISLFGSLVLGDLDESFSDTLVCTFLYTF